MRLKSRFQTAYPLRIQEIHIVNMPSYAQTMVNMVLGVLKKKIANRVSCVRRVSKQNIVYNEDYPIVTPVFVSSFPL